MSINKTVLFIHVATINHYQTIFNQIFSQLIDSDLINHVDTIYICIVGNDELIIPDNDKIIINQTPNVDIGEFYTLGHIEGYCKQSLTNDKILYIHTKGVTTPNNVCIDDWREYMLFFNVMLYKQALQDLETYDTYGVDLVNEPTLHYSGNFWWANLEHIRRLPSIDDISKSNAPKILTTRHNAEFWVTMVPSKNKSAHNSNINVYERHLNRYEKNKYVNENI